jgi:hypothetical protein
MTKDDVELKRGMNILQEIAKNNKPVLWQVEEFKRQTGLSKSTFFRYKGYLSGKKAKVTNSASYRELQRYKENFHCYFCGTSKDIRVHHRDGNTNNNNIGNLLILCAKCHRKLHCILKIDGKYWIEK